jgi:hypothetical protein
LPKAWRRRAIRERELAQRSLLPRTTSTARRGARR